LYRRFKKEHIDVLHVHGWGVYPEAFVAAEFAGVKVKIVMDHGRVTVNTGVKQMRSLYSFLKDFILKFFINRTNAFIAVSQDIQERLIAEKHIPVAKTYVVHNGIPDQFNSENHGTEKSIIEKIKEEGNSFILCSVGRLAKIKNYDTLIKAFAEVLSAIPSCKLIILGDGPERNHLEECIAELNLEQDVFLPGFNSEISSNIKHADIFILPSFFEGISISLLEAMSAGLPVIASNVGGNVELIEHNINGFLFSPENTDRLAQCILNLCRDQATRSKFSDNTRQKFKSKYSIETALNQYHTLYYKFV
jgi:glycosyltransferase involved in cell wall biosynthesis